MRRPSPLLLVVLTLSIPWASGCRPQQPHYLFEDGDLSHYVGEATKIEYPDSRVPSLDEVAVDGQNQPLTLESLETATPWPLTLEQAVQYTLANSKVMRSLGGQVSIAPEDLTRGADLAPTVYDPALMEANPQAGTEAALAAFDAQLRTSVTWGKNDTPRNVFVPPGSPIAAFFPTVLQQDLGNFSAEISKTNVTGGTTALRHNVRYDWNNTGSRFYPSDWNVNLEAEFRQPLLQGAGVQFNRIAGPGAVPGINTGVVLARINTDVRLADFEASVRNMVMDVERAYWELYLAYRLLDTAKRNRDDMLKTWDNTAWKYKYGKVGAAEEAQVREQYFQFQSLVQQGLNNVYTVENNLRYIMGLSATDGRLIRPSDEPTTAKISFPWQEIHYEGLARSVELRRQRWKVKQREMELIAAKNYLLPRLDAVGTYRWLGAGDHLISTKRSPSVAGTPLDPTAYQSLTGGQFQEWSFGLELSLPIGFRREMAGVRYAQLNLARERAVLQDEELEVSHQIAQAVRSLQGSFELTKTGYSRLESARHNVKAVRAAYDEGAVEINVLLEAQRRVAEAEADYYRFLVAYSEAIATVHLRKGSLLEYNGVYLAEGPWPAKAYFDATRQARARDAALFMDYGYTRPKVISRGAYEQHIGTPGGVESQPAQPETKPTEAAPEPVPAPKPMPLNGPQAPDNQSAAAAPAAGQPAAASSWVAVAAPDRPSHELASGLGVLAGGRPAGGEIGTGGVRPVSFQQPAAPAASGVWTAKQPGSTSPSVRHEPVQNPPPGQADRPSSGWKRLQY